MIPLPLIWLILTSTLLSGCTPHRWGEIWMGCDGCYDHENWKPGE